MGRKKIERIQDRRIQLCVSLPYDMIIWVRTKDTDGSISSYIENLLKPIYLREISRKASLFRGEDELA